MSKAIQGAVMIGAAVGIGAAIFFTGGAALAALPILAQLGTGLLLGGAAMEAGAIADALTQQRGMGITTRQAAAFRRSSMASAVSAASRSTARPPAAITTSSIT